MTGLSTSAALETARHVSASDPEYLRQAEEEARFWGRPHWFGCEAQERKRAPDPIEKYTNRRFTGYRGIRWYETIAGHGTFRRGLLLGTSGARQEAHILETNPGLHLTFCDISSEALDRRSAELEPRFPGRVATRSLDLNFAELEPEAYDVIISSSTMHHIINLEHVADQMNRALTPDGLFFLQDYVGEARYAIVDEKRRLFEQLHHREMVRQGNAGAQVEWMTEDERDVSPFCAVRSDETLKVLAQYLQVADLRTSGALVFCLLLFRRDSSGQPTAPGLRRRWDRLGGWLRARVTGTPVPSLSDAFWRELLLFDELACDTGILRPCNAFAVYRKRSA